MWLKCQSDICTFFLVFMMFFFLFFLLMWLKENTVVFGVAGTICGICIEARAVTEISSASPDWCYIVRHQLCCLELWEQIKMKGSFAYSLNQLSPPACTGLLSKPPLTWGCMTDGTVRNVWNLTELMHFWKEKGLEQSCAAGARLFLEWIKVNRGLIERPAA